MLEINEKFSQLIYNFSKIPLKGWELTIIGWRGTILCQYKKLNFVLEKNQLLKLKGPIKAGILKRGKARKFILSNKGFQLKGSVDNRYRVADLTLDNIYLTPGTDLTIMTMEIVAPWSQRVF